MNFTESYFKNIPLHFILSTGRTGSTLLSTMLNAHPEIISVSEEPFMLNLYDGYSKIDKWTEKIIDNYVKDFYLFSSGKLSTQFGSALHLKNILLNHKEVLTIDIVIRLSYFAFFPSKEKGLIKQISSKELILHTQLKKITRIFPEAKFTILVRDPRDNVLIKINRAKRRGVEYNFNHFCVTWRNIYSLLLTDLTGLAANRFFILKYEDLILNPSTKLKELCQFLDLKFDEAMLTYDEKNIKEYQDRSKFISNELKLHLERDHVGLTQKLDLSKIGLWKKELTKKQSDYIWKINKKIALKFGYTEETSTSNCKLGFSYFANNLFFIFYFILRPKIYYQLPFVFRKIIRKIKFKHSKEHNFISTQIINENPN